MTGNHLQIFQILTHHFCQLCSDKTVRSAVEAVLPHVILLIVLIRETIHKCLLRNRLMECCIEYNNLRNMRHDFLACPESQCMTVIVNRSQFPQIFNFVNDFIGYQRRLFENFCTLYDTMSDSRYLVHAGNHSSVTGGQSLYQPFKCFGMGREIAVFLYISAICSLVTQVTINANTVTISFCNNRFIFHINQLILQRGAASIYNENNHKKIQSFLMMVV